MAKRLTALAGAALAGLTLSACSQPPSSSSSAAPAAPAPASAPALWGEFKPVVSVKELMRDVIDPLSDNVFNAVSVITTRHGAVETAPKSEDDWQKVRTGAVGLAESIYLLKVPRDFTPPGVENNIAGSDVVELSAAQIRAKVERDTVEWNARIEAVRNASLTVLEIVNKKDANALWEAGEVLDGACEACHRSYWYPGENAAFYQRLRARLKAAERSGASPDAARPQP